MLIMPAASAMLQADASTPSTIEQRFHTEEISVGGGSNKQLLQSQIRSRRFTRPSDAAVTVQRHWRD